jgi:hypothetical protein
LLLLAALAVVVVLSLFLLIKFLVAPSRPVETTKWWKKLEERYGNKD